MYLTNALDRLTDWSHVAYKSSTDNVVRASTAPSRRLSA